jgi:alkanesulfonate monooxygenase SsuD/methylene tetrahydromethanopterin reductase-like flavin-dependent oxidoreductase (luciferase family)
VSREDYDRRAAADGPLFVGSPQEIIDKIAWEHELFGHQRYLAQVDIGGQPYETVSRTLDLLGTKVLPAVRHLR